MKPTTPTSHSAFLPFAALALTTASFASTVEPIAIGLQPNPPQWPETVHIFTPENEMTYIEETLLSATEVRSETKAEDGRGSCDLSPFLIFNSFDPATHQHLRDRVLGHFSDSRFAFLFAPGTYSNLSLPVGYYVQVNVAA